MKSVTLIWRLLAALPILLTSLAGILLLGIFPSALLEFRDPLGYGVGSRFLTSAPSLV